MGILCIIIMHIVYFVISVGCQHHMPVMTPEINLCIMLHIQLIVFSIFISWWLVFGLLISWWFVIEIFISWWLVIETFISWWLIFWRGIPWPSVHVGLLNAEGFFVKIDSFCIKYKFFPNTIVYRPLLIFSFTCRSI